jgi:hypothetical protein
MRRLADELRIRHFMQSLGAVARAEARLYFTGGATAVLLGWRSSTIDVVICLVPELDSLLRALPRIKEELELNIELASPADFIPALPGWEDRSRFVGREGMISFFHFDLYAQALAKIERSHSQDIADVSAMLNGGLVDRKELTKHFNTIFPNLYQYPAIDPASFRLAVDQVVGAPKSRRACRSFAAAPPGVLT